MTSKNLNYRLLILCYLTTELTQFLIFVARWILNWFFLLLLVIFGKRLLADLTLTVRLIFPRLQRCWPRTELLMTPGIINSKSEEQLAKALDRLTDKVTKP